MEVEDKREVETIDDEEEAETAVLAKRESKMTREVPALLCEVVEVVVETRRWGAEAEEAVAAAMAAGPTRILVALCEKRLWLRRAWKR